MRKTIFVAALSATSITGLLLAGCAGPGTVVEPDRDLASGPGSIAQCVSDATGGAAVEDKETVSLDIISHDAGAAAAFKARAAEISVLPDSPYIYEINETVIPAADVAVKTLTGVDTGVQVPDIAGLAVQFFSTFADVADGKLVDMTDFVADDRVTTRNASWSVDGRLYAIESGYGLSAYYYNAAVFDELGIDPTEIVTWDDLVDVAVEKGDGKALNGIIAGAGGFTFLLAQRGGGLFDADGNPTVDSAEAQEVLQFMKDATDAGAFRAFSQADFYGAPNYAAMQNTEVIGYAFPDWFLAYFMKPNIPDQEGDWRAMPMPVFAHGGHTTSGVGGHGWMVPTGGDNVEASTLLVRCGQATTEAQVRMFLEAGYLPHNQSAFDSPEVFDFEDPFLGNQKVVSEVFATVADDAPTVYGSTFSTFATTTVETEVANALAGRKSVEQALADAQAAIEAEMKR